MASKREQADLFAESPIEFEIDGVVLPADHSVYKLFPGKTYRLAKAMRETSHAFLDIGGLGSLEGKPTEWTDETLLRLITADRLIKTANASSSIRRRKRSGSEQDKKRLGFLKALFFTAKKGDLIIVPLGEGFDGEFVVGELLNDPGMLDRFDYNDDSQTISTYGRRVAWIKQIRRDTVSRSLVKSILSPTAFHLVGSSFQEEIYISVYGTFAFGNIYVSKFETDRERLGAHDYANIGVMFNGLAVAHDSQLDKSLIHTAKSEFYTIAIECDGSATIEFRRNSPISAIVRTLGPLAFSAAVMVSGAAEGKTLDEISKAKVVARAVGSAKDRCRLEVPPDLMTTATGLGKSRYLTFCNVRQKVEDDTRVKSPAHLKKRPKASKRRR